MSNPEKMAQLKKLAALIRYYILAATTEAGSGHPTSSLSATELMTALLFGGYFRYDADHPEHPNNDRLIFSKGHASPLFYALWAAAGKLSAEELIKTYRKFGSPLEGHPTVTFPYTEAATGSLGQGLSVGLGMALNAKYLDKLPYLTYVLLGDSEMAEGSQWEAIQLAAHYELDNLIAILDVNRLGQRGETMYGHDVQAYGQRIAAFGWETILVDGHSLEEILPAYQQAALISGKPVMIIAKTIKGKGVSFIEDKNGWHGKALSREEFARALPELGAIDKSVRGEIPRPHDQRPLEPLPQKAPPPSYPPDKPVATRVAYGNALKRIYPEFPRIVSLDGEVSNSTMAEIFQKAYPERFFEMYIAEQNMVGMGLGLSRRGKIPFVSTFAAFFSRAYDQIRMSQYSDPNLKFVGSHAGVSIGEDGPSQMGLEDLAMFRAIGGSVVLYPGDAVATERLVEAAARHHGLVYLRTTRQATPILYGPEEDFTIGGSKVLRRSDQDAATVITAGITLLEALKAWEELQKEGIFLRVIDLYSIKPLDLAALQAAARETKALITVEDHYPEGGLGEAVRSALAGVQVPIHTLAVTRKPKSGKPAELLNYEEISRNAIVKKVKEITAMGKPVLKLALPGEGRLLGVAGGVYTFKVEGSETGGTYTLLELSVPPGSGPLPHVHAREVEAFYILEGTLSFKIGDQSLAAPPGTFVQAPPGLPHAFKNHGPEPVRALMWVFPAGIENFFDEVGQPAGAVALPVAPGDAGRLQALASKYGIRILETKSEA